MSTDPLHQLTLVPLTPGSWRMCDHAVATSDAGSMIAYVERTGEGAYEVAWVAARLGVETFASLEAVLTAGFELLSGRAHVRTRVPFPITLVPAEPLA